MARTVTIPVNVSVPDGDDRTAADLAAALRGAIEVGSDDDSARDLGFEVVAPEPPRTILIHLNVEAPASDERTGDEIAAHVVALMETGLGGEPGSLDYGNELALDGVLVVCVPMAEEV